MSFSQSSLTMIFCLAIVFLVLIALSGLIQIMHRVIQEIEQKVRHGTRRNTPPGEFLG